MLVKQLSFLSPVLLVLGLLLHAACSSDVNQDHAAGDESTAVANSPSSLQDGKGTARVIPNDPVVINTSGTWQIVYSVGKEGIGVGGGIAVHISPYWAGYNRRIEIRTIRGILPFPPPTKKLHSIL